MKLGKEGARVATPLSFEIALSCGSGREGGSVPRMLSCALRRSFDAARSLVCPLRSGLTGAFSFGRIKVNITYVKQLSSSGGLRSRISGANKRRQVRPRARARAKTLTGVRGRVPSCSPNQNRRSRLDCSRASTTTRLRQGARHPANEPTDRIVADLAFDRGTRINTVDSWGSFESWSVCLVVGGCG